MKWMDLRGRTDIPKISINSTKEEFKKHQDYMNNLSEQKQLFKFDLASEVSKKMGITREQAEEDLTRLYEFLTE